MWSSKISVVSWHQNADKESQENVIEQEKVAVAKRSYFDYKVFELQI